MEPLSENKKNEGWYKQIYEARKRARRREKYFSCLAVFVVIVCLAFVASLLGLLVVGVVELINYL